MFSTDGPSHYNVFYNDELSSLVLYTLIDFSFLVLCSGFARIVGYWQALEGVAEISWGGQTLPGVAGVCQVMAVLI